MCKIIGIASSCFCLILIIIIIATSGDSISDLYHSYAGFDEIIKDNIQQFRNMLESMP
jgi:hypothetical protein